MLDVACNNIRYFINGSFTLPHIPAKFGVCTFLCINGLDLLHRVFVRGYFPHTHHRRFIDLRHIGSTIHLWTAFVQAYIFPVYGCSLPTSPSFLRHSYYTLSASRSIKAGISGRYSIIPPVGISVLLNNKYFAI